VRNLRRLLTIVLAATLAALIAPSAAEARPSDYPGMASYPTYNSRFYDGPAIGHLSNYVPQGLGYWKAKDALVLSYYNEDDAGSTALLSIRNRLGTKNERKWVRIVGGHAGGVVVGRKYLWVASTDANDRSYVYRYSLSRLAKARHGSYLTYDSGKRFAVATSSYLTLRGGDLWVGKHTTSDLALGAMYRYNISKRGNLSKKPKSVLITPGRVQGAVFSGKYVIYSRSWRRDRASTITVTNLSAGRSASFSAPSMTQGATIADGWFYLNTESGASKYKNNEDGNGHAINPIGRVHYASVTGLKGLV
jgi:hypothetical protein